jgi:O-antigen/teichoic acid export membrane protein
MEDKAKKYVAITLCSSLSSILCSIWFVSGLEYGASGVIAAGVIAQALTLGISLFSLVRTMPFHIDLSACYSLVKIGLPSIFGLFAFLLIDYADRQLMERMISLDAVGVYSVGYTLGMAINVGVGAFSAAWPPFFMAYINKPDEARIIFGRVLSYYVLLFGLIVVALFAFAKPAVLLLTAPNFHAAATVVGLTAAAYMLKGCYLICLPGVYFAHRLYLQSAVEWVAALVNIGLCFALIPPYGLIGAAWATLVSYLTLPVLAWVVSRPYLKVDYEGGRLARIVISVLAVSAGIFCYSTYSTIGPLVLLSIGATISGFFTLLMFLFVLTGSERRAIRTWLKR